jgi:hypothetical protein
MANSITKRPYYPYGIAPHEMAEKANKPTWSDRAGGLPDERDGWSKEDFEEAAAERRAGCSGLD